MEDLYIYKTIKEYYSRRGIIMPRKILSLLENAEPYLKDISDFLEELHLECTVVIPTGATRQFEFMRTIDNYIIAFDLDCGSGKEFWFIVKSDHYVFPEHDPRWLPINSIELLRKRFNSWVEQ